MSIYVIELLKVLSFVMAIACAVMFGMFIIFLIKTKKENKYISKMNDEYKEKFKAIKESKDYKFISKVSYYGSTFEPYSDDEFVYIPIIGELDDKVLYWKLDKKLFK